MSGALKGAAAIALLSSQIPTRKRIDILTPFFQPQPGQTIEVEASELRDFGKGKTNPLNLRGFIKVSPPKGACFTVTRNLDESDDKVCKPKVLSFTLSDLQKNGDIAWTIKTGPEDFGTELVWKTPYRMAILVPDIKPHKNTIIYKLIASCKAERKGPLGRKITLDFFDGDTWIIDFPENDELLPQPESIPNLYMAIANSKAGVPNKKKGDAAGTETSTSTASGTATGTQVVTTKGEGEALDQMDDRAVWGIPARNSYRMDGYRFMPFGTTTKWFKGICRYTYRGAEDDPDTGRMECHDVDGFDEVNMPLFCLKDLR
jgi:hypothetical protein